MKADAKRRGAHGKAKAGKKTGKKRR